MEDLGTSVLSLPKIAPPPPTSREDSAVDWFVETNTILLVSAKDSDTKYWLNEEEKKVKK